MWLWIFAPKPYFSVPAIKMWFRGVRASGPPTQITGLIIPKQKRSLQFLCLRRWRFSSINFWAQLCSSLSFCRWLTNATWKCLRVWSLFSLAWDSRPFIWVLLSMLAAPLIPHGTFLRKSIKSEFFVNSHGIWKSQKTSHSTLRAKRATFTFWVDKS